MSLPQTLPAVYIISKHPFKEVDDFVDASLKTYHLDLARYSKSMKEAFADYLEDHKRVKAIFVGTRRTDPHGATLQYFDPTDRGWPSFMRIHPVIDWHYAEIWTVSRSRFCSAVAELIVLPAVHKTFRDTLLSAVRSWLYVVGRHNRYASESSVEGRTKWSGA